MPQNLETSGDLQDPEALDSVTDFCCQVSALKAELVTARKATSYHQELTKNALDDFANQIRINREKFASQKKDLRIKQNKKLLNVNRGRVSAIRALKLKFQTEMDNVKSVSHQHKQATIRIQELEDKVAKLKEQNHDLSTAKATVEKELHDLKIKTKVLEGFESGYKQIKQLYYELQNDCNDLQAERDELKEKVRTLEEEEKESRCQLQCASTQCTSSYSVPSRLKSEHLDLLKEQWENMLRLQITSAVKKQEDIMWHDNEIAKLHQVAQNRI